MIFPRKGTLIELAVFAFLTGCGSADQENKKLGQDSPVSKATSSRREAPPPDQEGAETALAGYYSALNRQSGTNFYKGLELKILNIYRDSAGFQFIDAEVLGRRKKNALPDDSSSVPFREKLKLKLKHAENRWVSDSLISASPF